MEDHRKKAALKVGPFNPTCIDTVPKIHGFFIIFIDKHLEETLKK